MQLASPVQDDASDEANYALKTENEILDETATLDSSDENHTLQKSVSFHERVKVTLIPNKDELEVKEIWWSKKDMRRFKLASKDAVDYIGTKSELECTEHMSASTSGAVSNIPICNDANIISSMYVLDDDLSAEIYMSMTQMRVS